VLEGEGIKTSGPLGSHEDNDVWKAFSLALEELA